MLRLKSIGIPLFAAMSLILGSCQEKPKKVEDKAEVVNYLEESKASFDERMQWWRDARFGMFIHWGPYAVPAGNYKGEAIEGIGEWIMDYANIPVKDYEELSRQFNPEKFNASEWA